MANISVGTATADTGLIAATSIHLMAANEIWHDATPDATIELSSVLEENIVTENVIQTVTVESIQSGQIDYFCTWFPLSADSGVVVA